MAKYILLDLDGTLTDPKNSITRSAQYALGSCGIEVEDVDELRPFIGPPLREALERYYALDDSTIDFAIAKYREYFAEKGIHENVVYDGTEALLRALKEAGKTLLLATSKPLVYAEKILKDFGLYHYFTHLSGAELDGSRSKKSEVIRHALEQAGITDPDEAVMVGDREYDVWGAKELGIKCIGVLYGYGTREELEHAGADRIAKDVDELIGLLTQ